jgi:hypothetical protein
MTLTPPLAFMLRCEWLSINPGISVRPLPSITVAPERVSISPAEIALIRLPSISTWWFS